MSPALASMIIKFLVVLAMSTETATAETTQSKCENGGINDGNRCLCPEFTGGPRCQTILDSITIGKTFDAKMEATLTLNYTGEQAKFKSEYDAMMTLILTGINGRHVDTNTQFSNGEVTVANDIFLTIDYDNETEVSNQYEEKYNNVLAAFNSNTCKSRDFKAPCIKTYTSKVIRPPSKDERCAEKVFSPYLQYFDPVVNDLGLFCVSRCLSSSPNHHNCNKGNCQILGEEGPQCFCPKTDIYLYTYPRCGGAVSIVALYGGVGASIGLLVIVGVVLGVFFYRKKYYY